MALTSSIGLRIVALNWHSSDRTKSHDALFETVKVFYGIQLSPPKLFASPNIILLNISQAEESE